MRFLGFFWIKEWDDTYSKISATEERADMGAFLKLGIHHWVNMCYNDGVVHTVSRRYFDSIQQGTFDPNVY